VRGVVILDDAGMERAADMWWNHARNVVTTKDRDYNVQEFKRQFRAYHTPKIDWPVLARIARKDKLPAYLGKMYRHKATRRLLRAMARVQLLSGGKEFFMSHGRAASVLGGSRMMAYRLLHELEQDNVVVKLRTGDSWRDKKPGKGHKNKATTWRMKLDAKGAD
jgi:hypothetical protein